MKCTLFFSVIAAAGIASAAGTLGTPGASSATGSPGTLGGTSATSTGTLGGPATTSTMPMGGTSAGSPQDSGPLNSPPNGAGGTYGYPNSAVDPNTTTPGLPQVPYYGGPSYNYGAGSVSGTSTSVNAAGAPFVTPPAGNTVPQPMPNR